MSNFNLQLLHGTWQSHGTNDFDLKLRGQAYIDQAPVDVVTAMRYLSEATSVEALKSLQLRFNGFYAWVEQASGQIRAAVDHIRSIPLFYGLIGGQFFLSNDAEWVRQQVGDKEMDPVAKDEFQLAGYVTGQDTLFPNVKQLQAGEFLVAHQTTQGVVVETHRYYRFLHTEPETYDEVELCAELDKAAVNSIQRLVDYADGRQIVIPLSGGYDSRLIATLLKRVGYENVLTFTYGVPGNKESLYSKKVADALGLRWHFVEYIKELWREAWQTDERWQYQKWASGWTSIAHVQDWLAVKIMKKQGLVDPDCVFAPGHSGDFVAGSHIPDKAFTQTFFDKETVSDSLFTNHYALVPTKFVTKSRSYWQHRIESLLSDFTVTEAWQYADAYESWDWQERQAKFICNSVRVYEFFGHNWWMPLWDAEFMRFWEGVPLNLRKGREWYVGYVKEQSNQQSQNCFVENLNNASDGFWLKDKARSIIKKLNLVELSRKLIASLSILNKENYAVQANFLLSGADPKNVRELELKGYKVIGAYANLTLSEFTDSILDTRKTDSMKGKSSG